MKEWQFWVLVSAFVATWGPAAVAGTWVRALPARELDAIERMGVEKAGHVLEALFDGTGWDSIAERDSFAVQSRDELEGALAMLRLAGRGETLRLVLRILDEEAAPVVEVPATELTWAVGLVDPDAWWCAFDLP